MKSKTIRVSYPLTPKNAPAWIRQHTCVNNYIQRLQCHKNNVACDIYLYCKHTGYTPEQLLELKKDYADYRAEQLLDNFAADETLKMPATKKKKVITSVRAFYRVNYRQLQAEAGHFELQQPQQRTLPTKEELQRIYHEACFTMRDKAVFAVSSCTAIARETLSHLRWDMLEPNWQTQLTPHISIPGIYLKGHGLGKYRNVRQETFLTPFARDVLKQYRAWYTKKFGYIWKPDDHIFLHIHMPLAGQPLDDKDVGQSLHYITKRSNGRYQSHDGRRIVQTALESVGCPNNWIKKIKGRKCAGEEAPYSRPAIEQLRLKYQEALPELLSFSSVTQPGSQTKNEIYKLRSENDALRNRLDRIEELVRSFMQKNYEMLKI